MKPQSSPSRRLGLVLSGGGARSAYQAGVLRGLSQIAIDAGVDGRFTVIAGISGGAINGSFLACQADNWDEATLKLWKHWETLGIKDVINTQSTAFLGRSLRLISQLGFGGKTMGGHVTELLDARPLAQMLGTSLDFKAFRKNLAQGLIHGLGLSVTNYATGTCVTFYQGDPGIVSWSRSQRIGKRTNLGLKHVLASASIPVLFPPVKIHGSYYGDGAIRMPSPISPAIHMGADKVVAIGVRYYRTPDETVEMNRTARMAQVQLADILGILMNSIFLDALDSDLERMERINQTQTHQTQMLMQGRGGESGGGPKLRPIPILAIRPSVDLATLAQDEFRRFSPVLKHFLKGLGANEVTGADILSYLAFENSYTGKLLELGQRDAHAQKQAFLDWLKA